MCMDRRVGMCTSSTIMINPTGTIDRPTHGEEDDREEADVSIGDGGSEDLSEG